MPETDHDARAVDAAGDVVSAFPSGVVTRSPYGASLSAEIPQKSGLKLVGTPERAGLTCNGLHRHCKESLAPWAQCATVASCQSHNEDTSAQLTAGPMQTLAFPFFSVVY